MEAGKVGLLLILRGWRDGSREIVMMRIGEAVSEGGMRREGEGVKGSLVNSQSTKLEAVSLLGILLRLMMA